MGLQLHLLFNHLPILGTLFGLLVVLGGLILNNKTVLQTGYALLILAAILCIPATLSGEGAEEAIENLPNIRHQDIHEHEELAEIALWTTLLVGVLAALAFFAEFAEKNFKTILKWVVLLATVLNFGLMAQVGHLGGKIRRPDLDNSSLQPVPTEKQTEKENKDED